MMAQPAEGSVVDSRLMSILWGGACGIKRGSEVRAARLRTPQHIITLRSIFKTTGNTWENFWVLAFNKHVN